MVKKENFCYMDTDSFIVYIKTDDIYRDIVEDVGTKFDTSNDELECSYIEKPLPKGKNKKVSELMKDEFGRKIMTKIVELRTKAYSYLIDEGSSNRNKKCIINFEATEVENKINYIEKNKIDRQY